MQISWFISIYILWTNCGIMKKVFLLLLVYFVAYRLENSTYNTWSKSLKNNNRRRFCAPFRLYPNHCGSCQLNISGIDILLSGDVESNPGPSLCMLCAKTVRKNSKLVNCCRCQQKSHLRCVDPKMKSTIIDWSVRNVYHLLCHFATYEIFSKSISIINYRKSMWQKIYLTSISK